MNGKYENLNQQLNLNRNLKFLIVNNSRTMRKAIRNTLNKIGFQNFVEAKDGRDAYAKLYVEEPDIIFTDWKLSNMTGKDFVKSVRNDEKYRQLPILMLASRGMKQDVLEALKENIDSYIIQPITAQKVKEKIEKVLTQN